MTLNKKPYFVVTEFSDIYRYKIDRIFNRIRTPVHWAEHIDIMMHKNSRMSKSLESTFLTEYDKPLTPED